MEYWSKNRKIRLIRTNKGQKGGLCPGRETVWPRNQPVWTPRERSLLKTSGKSSSDSRQKSRSSAAPFNYIEPSTLIDRNAEREAHWGNISTLLPSSLARRALVILVLLWSTPGWSGLNSSWVAI